MPDPVTTNSGGAPVAAAAPASVAASPNMTVTPQANAPVIATPSDSAPSIAPEVVAPTHGTLDKWRDVIPTEFKDHASLKMIPDVPTLVKNYINAQKMVGADKIPVPTQHATDEDWKGVFQKLGLPAEAKDYNLKLPEGVNADSAFMKGFKEFAYKSNILPKQAEGLLSWYEGQIKSQSGEVQAHADTQRAAGITALRQEWGNAFDTKVLAAQVAFKEFGDEDARVFLNESKLAESPQLLKMFARIGETMNEDVVRGGVPRGDSSLMDPAAAKKAIGVVMGNHEHPYFNKNHANHATAVKEMADLNAQAFPQIKSE